MYKKHSRCERPRLPQSRITIRSITAAALLAASTLALAAESNYEFESGTTGGWRITDWHGARAVQKISCSKDKSYQGHHSLRADVDLRGSHDSLAAGEIFVDVRRTDENGQLQPVNLEDNEISMMVYCPAASVGEPKRPNGFQVFVKDDQWHSEYGPWVNVQEASWVRVALTPSRKTPPGGYRAKGFDPTRINVIGLKIGAGGKSHAQYVGPFYVDTVRYEVNEENP